MDCIKMKNFSLKDMNGRGKCQAVEWEETLATYIIKIGRVYRYVKNSYRCIR